jgi:hypothetical protein
MGIYHQGSSVFSGAFNVEKDMDLETVDEIQAMG